MVSRINSITDTNFQPTQRHQKLTHALDSGVLQLLVVQLNINVLHLFKYSAYYINVHNSIVAIYYSHRAFLFIKFSLSEHNMSKSTLPVGLLVYKLSRFG